MLRGPFVCAIDSFLARSIDLDGVLSFVASSDGFHRLTLSLTF